MSVPWPDEFMPDSPQSGFNVSPEDNCIRTGLKVRPRFTKEVERIQLSFVLKATRINSWRTFWRDELKFGSVKIEWKDPFTEDPKYYRVMSTPQYSHVEGCADDAIYRVTLDLMETLNNAD